MPAAAERTTTQVNMPGLRLIVVAIAMLLAWAMWSATQRTVRYDDADRGALAPLPDMRIRLNAASAVELSQLPGLGPKLAQRIVDDRDQRGRFKRVDDLDRVSGIGPSIIERLRPHVVID